MSLTVAVQMPDEDRAELIRWMRMLSFPAGLAQRARIVLLADEGVDERDRAAGRGVQADGDRVEEALRGRRDRRAGRSPEAGPTGTDR